MAASAKIIDLRNLLAERFPHPSSETPGCLTTGLPCLEKPIGGGLPGGAITELISPGTSAGSASLIHALVHCAYRDNYFLALIDGRDSFDPCGLDNDWLRHLLWVRCSKASEAVKAADLLLRDGNFPLVIVDLVRTRRRNCVKFRKRIGIACNDWSRCCPRHVWFSRDMKWLVARN